MKQVYDVARKIAGRLSQEQVNRIQAVVFELAERDVGLREAAYILATAQHETDHWRTMEEYASGAAYEGRKDLGNTQPGDGKRFKGRGYVQITGRRNYEDWSKRLGVDLVADPNLAMAPKYAVRILIEGMLLGTFTGKKLSDYLPNYVAARRVVNGTDRAAKIADHAILYEEALTQGGWGEWRKYTSGPVEPKGIIAAIIEIIKAIFKVKK